MIFPDTVPTGRMFFPLVPVFEPVVYFQAVEEDQVPPELVDQALDDPALAGRIRIQVPAPLGDDRDRFLKLVTDLRVRRDEYAAQLGHLTLAGVSAASRPARETKSAIVGSLLSSLGIREREDDARRMELWQARLVLKLAEIYDAEQAGLGRGLEFLESRQEALLEELRRETDNPFLRTEELSAVPPLTGERLQLRLKAWTRLFVGGSVELGREPVFVATGREPVDALAECYARMTGREAVQLATVELPAVLPDSAALTGEIFPLRNGDGSLTSVLDTFFRDGGEGAAGMETDRWQAELDQLCPPDTCGRCLLHLFGFSRVSARHIFARAFSPDNAAATGPAAGSGFVAGALVRG